MAFEGLTEKIAATFRKLRGKGRLKESDVKEAMREIRMALLEADVSYKVVKDFVKSVTERCVGTDVLEALSPAQMIIKIVNEELTALMGSETKHITTNPNGPTVVMMVGLQGAGKTTNGSKLAGLMKRQGKKPLLVACDIYRPAAIQQLKVCGEKLDISVFEKGQTNPVQIAKEAVLYARQHGHDMVFLDTAGRLHVDETLMQELKDMKAAVKPDEILLVVDAMTGQDAVNAAESFNEWLDVDSVMLSKLDGDARGGAALSVRAITGKPIKFAGIGEKLEDIEVFHPDRMASRILGMGDVLSLIEKVESLCKRKVVHTIRDSEPFGPANPLDMLIIAPCTGNTLAKLAAGIADTPVTLAAKSNLRNGNPVIIAVSTNDALSNAAKNIGLLMNMKNIYFVPYRQDDCVNKPTSIVADFTKIKDTYLNAIVSKQIQPVIL